MMECGATSMYGLGFLYQNQCLYLCLAAATTPAGNAIQPGATSIRTSIETAVRAARPTWEAQDFLGQEIGTFADFLTWGMQATPALRGRAIAVYDGRTGTCEVFRPLAGLLPNAPVLALWFTGAHYRWLRWRPPGPSLPLLLVHHRRPPSGAPRVITVITNAEG